MSDLRLTRTKEWDFDLEFSDGDLTLSDDLETAIIMSLFSWARRSTEDPDPAPGGDPMGWWGDETLDDQGDFIGSKLWLTGRSKLTPDLILSATEWGSEALQWMVDDKVAAAVEVIPTRSALEADRVDILVRLTKPGSPAVDYRYELNWTAQAARGTT